MSYDNYTQGISSSEVERMLIQKAKWGIKTSRKLSPDELGKQMLKPSEVVYVMWL